MRVSICMVMRVSPVLPTLSAAVPIKSVTRKTSIRILSMVTKLSRDDRYALGVFLQYHLRETVGKSETEAAELAGLMIGRSDRTVRDWKAQFYENDGNI